MIFNLNIIKLILIYNKLNLWSKIINKDSKLYRKLIKININKKNKLKLKLLLLLNKIKNYKKNLLLYKLNMSKSSNQIKINNLNFTKLKNKNNKKINYNN
jgi:hypothetical protein